MTKKISIIIPAYKVAGYIEKCIRSLENQDLSKDDYEIIVTNDGSPDNCREIVESLQQEFSNIVLINLDFPNFGYIFQYNRQLCRQE